MVKLPPYMKLISMKRESGEPVAVIQINWMHPSIWPVVARAIVQVVWRSCGVN